LAILIYKFAGSFSCEKCKNLSKQKINKDEAKNNQSSDNITDKNNQIKIQTKKTKWVTRKLKANNQP
jgi:hypothetical protein